MRVLVRPYDTLDWREKTYTGYPEPVPLAEYERQKMACVNALVALAPEIEIHDFGVVGTPGVSDIDLICFVHEDRFEFMNAALDKIPLGNLFVHPPVLMPSSIRDEMRWLFPISDFQPVRLPANAKDLPNTLTGSTLADLALIDSFNSAIVRWKGLSRRLSHPDVDVRQAMLSIWSARHTIETAYLAGLKPCPKWDAFAEAALSQRKIWRQTHQIELDQLNQLTSRVRDVLEEIVESCANLLTKRIRVAHSPTSLAYGRSVFVPTAKSDDAWKTKTYSMRFGRNLRLYHKFFLPQNVYDLLFWNGDGEPSLQKVAYKRALVNQKRSMSGEMSKKSQPLMARLLDPRSPVLHKRLLDQMILRRLN